MNQSEEGTRFIVLSSQRSGSTWLISLLNQVEPTRAYGELFLKRKKANSVDRLDGEINYPHFPDQYLTDKNFRPMRVFSYLDALFCQPGPVGFKLMYTQLQKYPEILAYLMVHRVRIVHLVRQNQLDVLISRAVKNKIKRAHILNGETMPGDIQVNINPQKLLERLKRRHTRIQAARKLLRVSMLPHLEVTYEDLLGDFTSFQQLCQFLNIKSGDHLPGSSLVKTGGRKHVEVVSNYSEIKKVLEETPFAKWVEGSTS